MGVSSKLESAIGMSMATTFVLTLASILSYLVNQYLLLPFDLSYLRTMSFTSFKFFSEVRPDFIKLDGSYTSNIDEDSNNKFFVRMMVDVARRIGIRVIATSVERQEEKLTLEKLLVDGLQGYYIAQPQAMAITDQI